MTDWRETTLGQFVSLQRGHDLPAEKRRAGSVPVMGSFGITGWHDQARALGPGVTVGRSGASVGVVSYIDCDYWPLNTCLFATNFHGNNPRFVYYFLQTLDLAAHNSGSAQPSLNRNYISPIKIFVPEPGIQNDIVNLLGSLDDKIELNRRMNETLEAMAQAIFRDWFVDFGPTRRKLEGATNPLTIMGGLVQDAERAQALVDLFPAALGDDGLPEGWTYATLAEALSVLETGSRPKGGVKGITGGVPSVGAESIASIGVFDFSKTKYVPREFFQSMKKGKVEDRDVLLYKDGGKPGAFEPHVGLFGDGFPFDEFAINEHVYRLRSNAPYSQEYLYFHLTSQSASDEMRIKGTGVAIPGLNSTAVKSLSILNSPAIEAFTQLSEPLVTKVILNARENQKLGLIRDLLLPKLMSGEIRLSEGEDLMEAAQ